MSLVSAETVKYGYSVKCADCPMILKSNSVYFRVAEHYYCKYCFQDLAEEILQVNENIQK